MFRGELWDKEGHGWECLRMKSSDSEGRTQPDKRGIYVMRIQLVRFTVVNMLVVSSLIRRHCAVENFCDFGISSDFEGRAFDARPGYPRA